MSYCRWSCMDWQCDVYAYLTAEYPDDDPHIAIHVASLRRVMPPKDERAANPLDLVAEGKMELGEDFTAASRDYFAWLERLPIKPIGLSRDGTQYCLPPDEAADLIESLIAEGYNVPDYVAGNMREDAVRVEATP